MSDEEKPTSKHEVIRKLKVQSHTKPQKGLRLICTKPQKRKSKMAKLTEEQWERLEMMISNPAREGIVSIHLDADREGGWEINSYGLDDFEAIDNGGEDE